MPFDWGDFLDLEVRGRVLMVIFTEPQTQQIRVRWLGYYAPSANYSHSLWQYDVNDFTGYFFEITEGGQIANILNIQNGVISGYHSGNFESAGSNGDVNGIEFRCNDAGFINWCCFWPFNTSCCPQRCPRFGPDIFEELGDMIGGIGGFIAGIFGGIFNGGQGEGDPDPNFVPGVFNFSPFGNFGHNFGGETNGPGTVPNLNGYFNNQIFNQTYDPARAQLVEQLRNNQGIDLPVTVLMLTISPYCFDEPESFDECALWSMANWIDERVNIGERRNFIEGKPKIIESVIRLMLVADESGFASEEIEYLVNEWIDNDGVYVPVKPIDWSQANMHERVAHLHKYLRYIQQMIDCDPRLSQPFYTMKPPLPGEPNVGVVGWFFTNVPPPGHSVTMNGEITYRFHNPGQVLAITIEWTALWNDQRFRISSNGPVATIDPNKSKIYYNYGDSSGQNSSVITIYFPSSSESTFLNDFKPPCRR
ncbi:MAG: hypothetical protein KF852_13835 [Saprospiraceae bacterium]|nr:hypothetical protein [Saprospiraceae bacterium]